MTFDARDIYQQQTIFSDPGQKKTTFLRVLMLSEGHRESWEGDKTNDIDFNENVIYSPVFSTCCLISVLDSM